MRAVLRPFYAACLLFLSGLAVSAQTGADLAALARLLPEASHVSGDEQGVTLDIGLSQPVPYRVFSLADPDRIVIDFREVAFGDWTEMVDWPAAITAAAAGPARMAGWSRLVLDLARPLQPQTVEMTSDPQSGQARVTLRLVPVSATRFAAATVAPPEAQAPQAVLQMGARPQDDGRLVVAIDPGHGGVDPGAVRGRYTEADLVLTFSRELRDALRRTGLVDVVLTREADVFVPLPARVTMARAVGADLFISVHADALAEGRARGATVYTLSDTASDAAAAALAEQHDRADLLQGIDLHGADDVVAGVLMDLARVDTAPRSTAFAAALVDKIGAADLRLHRRPMGEAGFTVLRAADIPSVLLEIGFMSDEADLRNIRDPDWRAVMQGAIIAAIMEWAAADAARMSLLRQ
ncbi:N-acetylmuramoyl-L-alanine amidase [Roseicyclus sp.]|uniref:N-acetylmuramoyl-L-alanine amidase n=1 Tax=Roseicyclus sp. TaxID=1914329 RepID=UPI003F6A4167